MNQRTKIVNGRTYYAAKDGYWRSVDNNKTVSEDQAMIINNIKRAGKSAVEQSKKNKDLSQNISEKGVTGGLIESGLNALGIEAPEWAKTIGEIGVYAIPVVGTVAGIADSIGEFSKGNWGSGLATLGLSVIPGGGIARGVAKGVGKGVAKAVLKPSTTKSLGKTMKVSIANGLRKTNKPISAGRILSLDPKATGSVSRIFNKVLPKSVHNTLIKNSTMPGRVALSAAKAGMIGGGAARSYMVEAPREFEKEAQKIWDVASPAMLQESAQYLSPEYMYSNNFQNSFNDMYKSLFYKNGGQLVPKYSKGRIINKAIKTFSKVGTKRGITVKPEEVEAAIAKTNARYMPSASKYSLSASAKSGQTPVNTFFNKQAQKLYRSTNTSKGTSAKISTGTSTGKSIKTSIKTSTGKPKGGNTKENNIKGKNTKEEKASIEEPKGAPIEQTTSTVASKSTLWDRAKRLAKNPFVIAPAAGIAGYNMSKPSQQQSSEFLQATPDFSALQSAYGNYPQYGYSQQGYPQQGYQEESYDAVPVDEGSSQTYSQPTATTNQPVLPQFTQEEVNQFNQLVELMLQAKKEGNTNYAQALAQQGSAFLQAKTGDPNYNNFLSLLQ